MRRHDILADPVEPARYDLVHCRALLCHLPDPARALGIMAAAVRPGGWLLVEDADYCSLVAADPAHPRAPGFNAVMRTLLAFIAAGRAFDPFFGRRLGPTLPLGKLTSRLYRSSTRPGPRIKPQADAPAGRWFLP